MQGRRIQQCVFFPLLRNFQILAQLFLSFECLIFAIVFVMLNSTFSIIEFHMNENAATAAATHGGQPAFAVKEKLREKGKQNT